jgi:hypothetical protein
MNKAILINGQGREYNLLDRSLSPGFQIEGFGYEDSTEFMAIGDNFIPLQESSEQGMLESTLLFMDGSDKKYFEFVKFARHNPLTLLYGNQNGEFRIPCRLRSISKVDQLGIRRYPAPMELIQTGKPYRIETAEYTPAPISAGKIYPYTYPYTYSSDLVNTLSVKSDSYRDSPCILTIYGQAVNPVWRHYNNGILVETGAYSGTIPEGHYLVIDAKSVPYSIIEYDSAGRIVADRYALCDFSTERFMHANEGRNRYVVSHDGVNNLQLKMEAHIQYETV